MKNLFKKAAAALAVTGLLLAPVVQAQYVPDVLARGQDVAVATVSTTAGYFPVLIRYVGTTPAGGTVTVDAATGDITLKTGPVASSVADATTECPVSGALGGVIDVSNAACNTLGEVVDAINASANWRAVIQDGLRTDSADNTLFTLAETSASVPAGLALAGDSTVSLNVTFALTKVRNDITQYLDKSPARTNLLPNPFAESRGIFWRASSTLTGTGADNFDVISVERNNRSCSLTASAVVCTASENVGSTYTEPGGTTGVNKTFDFTRFGLGGRDREVLLIRGRFATTLTALAFSGAGRVYAVPVIN